MYFFHSAEAYNDTAFEAWVEEGRQPVLPATLELFNNLTKLGFEIFFVTGRDEDKRNVTVENLTNVGYRGWTDLLLRYISSYEIVT
jgi:predicted secreted acid phosphatase